MRSQAACGHSTEPKTPFLIVSVHQNGQRVLICIRCDGRGLMGTGGKGDLRRVETPSSAVAMKDMKTRLSEGEYDFVAVYYLDSLLKWIPRSHDEFDGHWRPGEWESKVGINSGGEVCVRRKPPRSS